MSCRCARRSPRWSSRTPTVATSTSCACGSARWPGGSRVAVVLLDAAPRLRGHARRRAGARVRHRRGALPVLWPPFGDHVAVGATVPALRERRRRGAVRQRIPGDFIGCFVKGMTMGRFHRHDDGTVHTHEHGEHGHEPPTITAMTVATTPDPSASTCWRRSSPKRHSRRTSTEKHLKTMVFGRELDEFTRLGQNSGARRRPRRTRRRVRRRGDRGRHRHRSRRRQARRPRRSDIPAEHRQRVRRRMPPRRTMVNRALQGLDLACRWTW